MISCTEFIPAYSTLFSYLEEHFGPEEVPKYWGLHFEPNNHPIYKFIQAEGVKGCFTYWSGTLNEEAADFTMYLNEKAGWFLLDMHHCPSKGRLLKLRAELGVEPYHKYCLHCDHYRASVEACGLHYIYHFQGIDKAACSILIYDPALFDGRVIVDSDTQIMRRSAADNEYLHKAFHYSLNKGITYLDSCYGRETVIDYLRQFTDRIYFPVAKAAKINGLCAIEEKILDTYAKDHAADAVKTQREEHVLRVSVSYCPAEQYMRSTGVTVSPAFYLTTKAVMERLAENAGLRFSFDSYDPETGAAEYRFFQ